MAAWTFGDNVMEYNYSATTVSSTAGSVTSSPSAAVSSSSTTSSSTTSSSTISSSTTSSVPVHPNSASNPRMESPAISFFITMGS
ncbi:hypothetical protein COT83_04010 [Candidatus Peregrinibacteria bacterium CG10_big_fil_rev_8_21_14_0_10_44_7]|nr:MAG: hypothetical protein COT83_04010 [Candidatus Peregrinibacteria bacterium CG10_big_fil_rev_8_21_14_0_10_44_7]PJB88494.1 MAG: hypothetical protein CO082_04130 [Candidatus Peregrinibacteria bacterium CG_4_9_14_0_8_um_filter_44_15]